MSQQNFETIKAIAYQYTGITLSDHKRDMVYSRLARRLRSLQLDNFDQYCSVLALDTHPEHSFFINSITTNLTSFFREEHHFEFLQQTVFSELKKNHQDDRRVRIWSAGCSTGEEPYSIAMTAHKGFSGLANWDFKILATDLDSEVLAKAKSGMYSLDRVNGIDEKVQKRWFLKDKKSQGAVRVKSELQQMISFKRLNLMERWPMKGPFDVIFCRNVVIYFDKDTQKRLFDKFADMLAPSGYLFIGHSETLHRVTTRFESLGQTIYQRRN